MKTKKTDFKPYLLGIGVAYIFACLFTLHLCAYKAFYPRESFSKVLNFTMEGIKAHPFSFVAEPTNATTYIGLLTFIAVMGTWYWIASVKKNEHAMFNSEYGTAEWNKDIAAYNKKFADPKGSPEKNGDRNMILTQNVYMSMNTRDTRRNNNVLVIGGSGAGKSRFFVKPNLCQMPLNVSFVNTDPSGELLSETGTMLEGAGYKLKVFNLVNMSMSNHYNPLNYIHKENDVILLVDCILANTTDPNKKGGDDFWEKAQKLMFQSFIFLTWKHGDELGLEKNMNTIMMLMQGCSISENESSSEENETDKYFRAIESAGWYFNEAGEFIVGKPTRNSADGVYEYHEPYGKEDIAVLQYGKFKTGAGKTLKSILISAMARLSTLDSQEIRDLLEFDDIALGKIGDEKTALFVIIPQESDSFNFLAAMLYTQLFQALYYHAQNECQGNYLVVDKRGENVKAFDVPHEEEMLYDDEDDLPEEDVDFLGVLSISEKKPKKKPSFPIKLKKKSSEDKVKPKKYTEDEEEDIETSPETVPVEDPGTAYDEIENEANAFCLRAKNAHCTKRGNKYYIKVPGKPGEEEEVVGVYTNKFFAKKKLDDMKVCTIKRCGIYLPYHVRFMLDEFANIGQIPAFTNKLATMRKFEISSTIILQNLAQIKNMYEKDWGSIIGNCDSFLFLGCPEYDTQEYISKKIGKTTITVRDNSVSHGGKGSSSLSYKKAARDLISPDELGMLDDSECVLMIRAVKPFKGKKHQFTNHPNYKYTADADSANICHFKVPREKKQNKTLVQLEVEKAQIESSKLKEKKLIESSKMKNEIVDESDKIRQKISSSQQTKDNFEMLSESRVTSAQEQAKEIIENKSKDGTPLAPVTKIDSPEKAMAAMDNWDTPVDDNAYIADDLIDAYMETVSSGSVIKFADGKQ